MADRIKGIHWGLDGSQLSSFQAAQRLYRAGFTEVKQLAMATAIMRAESGWFLKAWNHNLISETETEMVVKSTDLGFIQRNVLHIAPVTLAKDPKVVQAFVDDLFFVKYPNLANGQLSANIAHQLYGANGFRPWFAYTNGSYLHALPDACLAVGNMLGVEFGLGPAVLRKS